MCDSKIREDAPIYRIRDYRETDFAALCERVIPYFREDLNVCYDDPRLTRVVAQMVEESRTSPEAFLLVLAGDDGAGEEGEPGDLPAQDDRADGDADRQPISPAASPAIIGFIQAQVDRPDRAWCEREGEGFIQECGVHPALRGMGYGRRLVEAAEARFLALGITRIYLTVAGNAHFWETQGYTDSGHICRRNRCPIYTRSLASPEA